MGLCSVIINVVVVVVFKGHFYNLDFYRGKLRSSPDGMALHSFYSKITLFMVFIYLLQVLFKEVI